MKKIVSFFYVLGLLLGSVGLIYSIAMLIVLNGVGDVFEMKEPEQLEIKILKDSIEVNIHYTYKVGDVENSEHYKINVNYFDRCKIDSIVVKYNANYPTISFIEGIPLKQREQKIGIFITSFFLLFLVLVWKLSDRDKWANTYEEVGNRPWLYPADQSIKNPLKRFKTRLFRR